MSNFAEAADFLGALALTLAFALASLMFVFGLTFPFSLSPAVLELAVSGVFLLASAATARRWRKLTSTGGDSDD